MISMATTLSAAPLSASTTRAGLPVDPAAQLPAEEATERLAQERAGQHDEQRRHRDRTPGRTHRAAEA